MKLLNKYINGNYTVEIDDNGTKIRETNDNKYNADFPECIDLKITNKCDMGCKYCHEDSTNEGLHGDLDVKFIDSLKPYTELALGGGNVLFHPNLTDFLLKLKEKHIIANMTVNQYHFMQSKTLIEKLVKLDLIKGLGISLINPTEEFINEVKKYDNAVIHVINGIVSSKDLEKLYNNNLKLLILGYKEFRRGKTFYNFDVEKKKKEMYNDIINVIKGFNTVSFDNLALKQLDIKRLLSNKDWNEFYMGNDGNFTMYIDLVNKKFAKNSISEKRYDLLDNIEEMFNIIKSEEA